MEMPDNEFSVFTEKTWQEGYAAAKKEMADILLQNRELRELLETIPSGPGEGMVSTAEESRAMFEWAERYRKVKWKRKDEAGNPWAPNKDYPGKPVEQSETEKKCLGLSKLEYFAAHAPEKPNEYGTGGVITELQAIVQWRWEYAYVMVEVSKGTPAAKVPTRIK